MVRRLFLLVSPAVVLMVVFAAWSRKPSALGPEEALYARLARHGVVRVTEAGYTVFADNVQGKKLVRAVVKHQDAGGNIDFVANAREGELRVDLNRNVLLVRLKGGQSLGKDGARAYFAERVWELPLPDEDEDE